MDLGKQILKEYEYYNSERSTWLPYWEELSKYILPMKNNVYGVRSKGDKRGDELFDSTAIHANELLASALHSMLINPMTMWMWMTTRDEKLDLDDEVRMYFQECAMAMHAVLNNSNFRVEAHEMFLDEGAFGTGFLLMEEDDEDIVRFTSRPIYETCLAENNKGLVDKSYRCFKWTSEQILEETEWVKNLSADIRAKMEAQPQLEWEIIHCVKPRKGGLGRSSARSLKKARFGEYYVLKQDGTLLEESGRYYFPAITPRWSKLSGEVYGRSPGMKCLPEIKMINEMRKNIIKADQLNIAPPMAVPDDGFILPIQLKPYGFTFYRAGSQDKIEPLLQNVKLNISMEQIQETRDSINRAFFIDQLQLKDGPQMTATEVMQRSDESSRLLSPSVGRHDVEVLKPLTENLFEIMNRKGKLPKAPKILFGKRIDFTFSSSMARAQLSTEVMKIQKALGAISGLAQVQPQVLDYVNGDRMTKYVFNAIGVPQSVINDDSSVKQVREARSSAQQQQMQMMEEQHSAEITNKVAPALGQINE